MIDATRARPTERAGRTPAGIRAARAVMLVVLSAVVAGCGTGAAPTPARPTTTLPIASATALPAPSAPAASRSPVVASPAARLVAALADLGAGYAFESSVVVGSAVATTAEGRWVAGTSEFVVTSGGTSVTYRSVPPRAWVREADGSWVELDGTPPGGSPLDALRSPLALSTVSDDADRLRLTATYPASQLGLTGSADASVALVLAADGSLEAAFATTIGGLPATSTTTFRPTAGQAPVEPPASPEP